MLQWQHVIIGQRTLTWWYMDVCINVYSTTVATSPLVQNIHPLQLPGCDVSILTNWPPSSHSQFQVVVSSESKLNSNYSSTHCSSLWQPQFNTQFNRTWLLNRGSLMNWLLILKNMT